MCDVQEQPARFGLAYQHSQFNERTCVQKEGAVGGHPSIALYISLWNLAVVHKARKQYEKALPMVEEVYAIWSAAHGLEHEDTRDAAGHGIAAVDIG